MSQTETHFGKLRKVDIGEQTLEQWCEAKCNEIGITQLSSYFESWQDELHDSREFYEKFFIVDNEVWEAIEHTELEDGYDIDILNPNEDGTITFVQQFYNGGTCLSECIEEGLKRMKK